MNRSPAAAPADNLSTQTYPKAPPVLLLGLAVGSAVMGLTILTPALPLIQQGFAASSDTVQLLITFYVIALTIGQLVYGTISDRFGRRPILLLGAGLLCLGGLASLMTQSIEMLVLSRVLQGAGAAACLAMSRTIVNDCYPRQEAARTMSTVQTIQAVVPMLSLAFGGLLAQYTSWQGAMAITAIAGLLVFLLTLWRIQETHLNKSPTINLRQVGIAYLTVLRSRIFLAFAICSSLQVGMFIALNGFLPYQYERLGVSPMEFGLWFSLTPACYFLGNLSNRLYFVSRGIERAAMIGCSLTLLSVSGMCLTQAVGMTHPLSLAIPGMLFGFSNGITIANTFVGAISACDKKYAGTGSGLAGAMQMAVGGIAGSLIIALGGADNFLLASGVLILMSILSVVSVAYVYRRRASLSFQST